MPHHTLYIPTFTTDHLLSMLVLRWRGLGVCAVRHLTSVLHAVLCGQHVCLTIYHPNVIIDSSSTLHVRVCHSPLSRSSPPLVCVSFVLRVHVRVRVRGLSRCERSLCSHGGRACHGHTHPRCHSVRCGSQTDAGSPEQAGQAICGRWCCGFVVQRLCQRAGRV